VLDQRARLLFAALGFVGLRAHPTDAVIDRLHRWLDSWSGIGYVVAGMARQGYDVELRRYDGQGWRATFYAEGFEHSRTAYSGSAWAPTPWEATQRAAAETLDRLEFGERAPRDLTLTDDSPA
jgi:hypothetical protein